MRNLAVGGKQAGPSVSATGSTSVSSGTVVATGAAGVALALDSHVDGLEGLITSTNTKLDTIITALGTHLATIETNTTEPVTVTIAP